ncbi:MAG TPA: ELWxxDGT repeat protein [Myxococcus sp.]|nr:ELWxxDGT repeat protein [Myxococcus sp.]
MNAWRGVLVSVVVVGLVGCGPALVEDEAGAALESRGAVADVTAARGDALLSGGWEVCSEEARRVRDIRRGRADSAPDGMVEHLGLVFFTADDGTSGRELWVSAGREEATVRVKDIRPGSAGSAPAFLTPLHRWVLFVADDGRHGPELWRADSSAVNAELVRDILPGSGGSFPDQLTRVGDFVYFTANSGPQGTELWRTDGTAQGTVRVHDFEPGPGSPGFGALTAWKDQLALVTYHESGDVALWAVSGQGQVRRLFLGSYVNLLELTPAGHQLFFLVEDPDMLEATLWVTRGEPRTAVALRYFPGARPMDLTALGYSVYFVAGGEGFFGQPGDPDHGSELWGSDGTVAGTRLVRDIQPGPGGAFHSEETSGMVAVGPSLYFAADDGESGLELWGSNGTAGGTALVRDLEPGAAGSGPANLTGVNGVLFFSASTAGHGREAWYSHGRSWSTRPLKHIAPGPADSNPAGFTHAGWRLFFRASDRTSGEELWAVPFRPLEFCGYN